MKKCGAWSDWERTWNITGDLIAFGMNLQNRKRKKKKQKKEKIESRKNIVKKKRTIVHEMGSFKGAYGEKGK